MNFDLARINFDLGRMNFDLGRMKLWSCEDRLWSREYELWSQERKLWSQADELSAWVNCFQADKHPLRRPGRTRIWQLRLSVSWKWKMKCALTTRNPQSGWKHKVSHPSRDARLGTPPWGEAKRKPQETVVENLRSPRSGRQTNRHDLTLCSSRALSPASRVQLSLVALNLGLTPQVGVPGRPSRLRWKSLCWRPLRGLAIQAPWLSSHSAISWRRVKTKALASQN